MTALQIARFPQYKKNYRNPHPPNNLLAFRKENKKWKTFDFQWAQGLPSSAT
jgi:hypothetical protein